MSKQKAANNLQIVCDLKSNSETEIWEAAKRVLPNKDARLLRDLIKQLTNGPKRFHRMAAAYALASTSNKSAIPALERVLLNQREHAAVRGEAAEALATLSSNRSIPLLTRCLTDASKEVRFWCAYALGVAGTLNKRKAAIALPALRELGATDKRIVRGFWQVRDEAQWAVANIEGREREAREIERRLGWS